MGQHPDGLLPPTTWLNDCQRMWTFIERDPRLRRQSDPSDAVQQTFYKAITRWSQYRGKTDAELLAWLRKILTHHLIDVARRRRPNGKQHSLEGSGWGLISGVASNQPTPSTQATRRELLARLALAMMQLPEDQRIALELKHLQSCSVSEVCEQMGKSSAAVAGLLRRGLQTLRVKLDLSA